MIRPVLRAVTGGSLTDLVEVGDGWETWNAAIGASCGELVRLRGGKELWCNENGLAEGGLPNEQASKLARRAIVGDVILFNEGDIT